VRRQPSDLHHCSDREEAAQAPHRRRHPGYWEKSSAWLQNAIGLALITAQRRTDILSMKFEDVRDDHLVRDPAEDGKVHRHSVDTVQGNPELQVVIDRCRDNILSPYLIHRRRGAQTAKAGRAQRALDEDRGKVLTRAFKDARDAAECYASWKDEEQPGFHEVRALSLHLYKKAGKDE